MNIKYFLLVLGLIMMSCSSFNQSSFTSKWNPAENPLYTKWTKDVNPNCTWQEYPRPQMKRDRWLNLNGLWNYAITGKDESQPENYMGIQSRA
jgi:hypothetical protein